MASSQSPTHPERELALALVGTEARRAQSNAQIGALATKVNYAELEALLRENGMLSLIGHRLLETNGA